ncbi:MAG TPA: patatin-like phospholipase family protein, partial [Flavobacteriales bacterium]|nr:patatin-like phospholipase family protein [Flavobacteriales bacterium]
MIRRPLLLLFLCLAITPLVAQQPERLGLVLSGGGAKGLAHIGVLKVLEEEGIRPDVITGTSMGSLIGGLYACGYNARQIEQLVLDIRWDELLTNKLPLDRIAIEEKPYYGRFLVEIPFNGLSPQLPSGLIRGQKLDEMFRRQTLPYHGTTSFDSLAIPYACIATDVGNGKAVVMRNGLLADAMRASMSIPTAFTPLFMDSLMFIDGGAMRNFPVSDARDMGATLVIGVSVSEGLMPAAGLHDAVEILTQAAMFHSLVDDPNQIGLCDVFIKPDISGYNTASFYQEAVPVLIQRGYDAANAQRAQIRALAARLPADRQHMPPPEGLRVPDSLRVDRLVLITDRKSIDPLLRGRLPSKGHIAVRDLEKRIDLLYGSLNFDLINYRVDPSKGDSALVVKAMASPREKVGISLNFDSFNQASAGFLVVSRDRLMKSSRLLAEGYISRYPQVDASFLKYTGRQRRSAISAGGYFARGPFYTKDIEDESVTSTLRYDRYGGYLRVQSASSVKGGYGVEFGRDLTLIRPKVGAEIQHVGEDTVTIDLSTVDRLRSARWAARAFAQFNTFDRPIYPRRGWKLSGMAGYFWNAVSTLEFDGEVPAEFGGPAAGNDQRLNDYDDFERLYLHAEGIVPLRNRFAAMVNGDLAFSSESQMAPGDLLLVGGMKANGRESVAFWGLNEYDEGLPEFGILRAGWQWELTGDLFWQAQANALFTGLRKDPVRLDNG